jgi:hypothetical protein
MEPQKGGRIDLLIDRRKVGVFDLLIDLFMRPINSHLRGRRWKAKSGDSKISLEGDGGLPLEDNRRRAGGRR